VFKWIKKYKTWSIFLTVAVVGVLYLGYTNLWEPVSMMEDAKIAAGETVDTTKNIIEFVAQKDIIELIKVLTPFLLPLITWKIKSKMDSHVKQTTNKMVRQKLKIADRRRTEVTVTEDRRKARTGTINDRKKKS